LSRSSAQSPIETEDLADPGAGGEQEEHERAVPLLLHRRGGEVVNEAFAIGVLERLRQPLGQLGQVDRGGEVARRPLLERREAEEGP
jgi:hypothetical protein